VTNMRQPVGHKRGSSTMPQFCWYKAHILRAQGGRERLEPAPISGKGFCQQYVVSE